MCQSAVQVYDRTEERTGSVATSVTYCAKSNAYKLFVAPAE